MAFKKNVAFKVTNQLVTPIYFTELNESVKEIPCYLKINGISGDKEFITIQLLTRDINDPNISYDIKTYNFIPSVEHGSENFIKQGYEYLKTLPEFSDVIDVLE